MALHLAQPPEVSTCFRRLPVRPRDFRWNTSKWRPRIRADFAVETGRPQSLRAILLPGERLHLDLGHLPSSFPISSSAGRRNTGHPSFEQSPLSLGRRALRTPPARHLTQTLQPHSSQLIQRMDLSAAAAAPWASCTAFWSLATSSSLRPGSARSPFGGRASPDSSFLVVFLDIRSALLAASVPTVPPGYLPDHAAMPDDHRPWAPDRSQGGACTLGPTPQVRHFGRIIRRCLVHARDLQSLPFTKFCHPAFAHSRIDNESATHQSPCIA